jgi:hypothetical protein
LQSGHRPIQRGTNYGIDGAFPDSLQPSLLRAYEWASREWHRYLKHESKVDKVNTAKRNAGDVFASTNRRESININGTQMHVDHDSMTMTTSENTPQSQMNPSHGGLNQQHYSGRHPLQEIPSPNIVQQPQENWGVSKTVPKSKANMKRTGEAI